MRAKRQAHPEGERLETLRRDERPESERQVKVAGLGAVPLATQAAATGALRAGEHCEGRFLSRRETSFCLGIRTVYFGEQLNGGRDLEATKVCVEQRRVDLTRDGLQLIALPGRSLKREAIGAESLQPAPDRHAGYAEFFRETVPADRFAVGFEEREEDAAVEGGHGIRANRGRGRTTARHG